jgi:hypothetical protein
MRMEDLANTPPFDWPKDVGARIGAVLRDGEAPPLERLLAAELAASSIAMSDALAEELLRILKSPDEPDSLRSRAARAFGPAIREAEEIEGPDWEQRPRWTRHLEPSAGSDVIGTPDWIARIDETAGLEDEDVWRAQSLSWSMLETVKAALRSCYRDPSVPTEVRQRALTSSIHAAELWHVAAVRAAYYDGEPEWRLTALSCMRVMGGFEREIVESLESDDARILCLALLAAGDRCLDEAWPHVLELASRFAAGASLVPGAPELEWDVVVAVMYAIALIRPAEAEGLLEPFIHSENEDLAEAALEALEIALGPLDEEEDDDVVDGDGLDLENEDDATWH